MHPGSFWWDWISEVLIGLWKCTCHSHRHTPFFLLHKQDPVVPASQMEADNWFPITWDVSLDAEGKLAE